MGTRLVGSSVRHSRKLYTITLSSPPASGPASAVVTRGRSSPVPWRPLMAMAFLGYCLPARDSP